MKAAARVMQRGASIINLSSVAGLRGTPGAVAYGASKWAVRGLTKSAAAELGASRGIRCNSVHPGLISTQMLHDGEGKGVGIARGAKPETVPLGRLGEAAEVAQLVLFLASDESKYMSGSELTIDGAMVAKM
eukprot:SAG11_NODE_3970_length_2128_cov_1.975850_2_plen_132_part_00